MYRTSYLCISHCCKEADSYFSPFWNYHLSWKKIKACNCCQRRDPLRKKKKTIIITKTLNWKNKMNSNNEMLSRVVYTKTLWSNCTVVGFSKKFLRVGEKASKSSGIHRSPIFGNELYTNPPSKQTYPHRKRIRHRSSLPLRFTVHLLSSRSCSERHIFPLRAPPPLALHSYSPPR